jgi:hypothetical protein
MLGKSEKELLAYDEYDSEGSGKLLTIPTKRKLLKKRYGFSLPMKKPLNGKMSTKKIQGETVN